MRGRPPDIRTLTPGERRREELARRQRRYLLVLTACVLLVLLAVVATPLPTPVRLALAVLGAALMPVAALVGSRNPF